MQKITKLLFFYLCVTAIFTCAGSTHQAKTRSSNPPSDESGEQAPVIIKNVTPVYPPVARAQGDTATIWLKVYVDTLGIVSNPVIVQESGDNLNAFEQSAIDAALKTKWKPARSNGKPFATWVTYKVDFFFK
jgi:TonB family protein